MSEDKDNIVLDRRQGQWIAFSQITEVVNSSLKGNWDWFRNSRCKYINLRIDMRDGNCLIKDRDEELITLEQLRYQFYLDKR